jgi:hypothetical protein
MKSLRPVEAELRERDGSEEGERDRDEHGDGDYDHAVRRRAPEVGPVHRILEVLERRVDGNKLGFSLFSWSVGWNALENIQ